MEVAMVGAVLISRYERMRRSGRIMVIAKDLETD